MSTQKAVEFFTSRGVPRNKLIIGIPLYGRSFMNTVGPGAPFSGMGPGSWEKGVSSESNMFGHASHTTLLTTSRLMIIARCLSQAPQFTMTTRS